MTLTEAQVASLRQQKTNARPELSIPRELRVLRPGEGLAAPPPQADVSDDFYELTADDLQSISLGGGGTEPKPALQTAAMRELSRLQSLKAYSHALVRVRLPGGLMLQASFHPQEPVSHVLSLIRSCLTDELQQVPSYLFTTPPRTVLKPAASLVEANLVPAATAILAWEAPLPAHLASLTAEEMLSQQARDLLATAAAPLQDTAAFPTAMGQAATAARGAGEASGVASRAGKQAASAAGDAAAEAAAEANKGGKPKWLKR